MATPVTALVGIGQRLLERLNNTSPAVVAGGWPTYKYADLWGGTDSGPAEAKVARREQLIDFFIGQVRKQQIGFPYQQFFRPPAEVLFKNIQDVKVVTITTEDKAVVTEEGRGKTVFVVLGSYQLHSYFPKWRSFGGTSPHYLNPITGQDEPTVVLSPKSSYPNMDVISDLFQEPVRMTGKRFDSAMEIGGTRFEQVSVAECWNRDSCLRERILRPALDQLKPDTELTARYLREIIYQNIPETRSFNPTWSEALLSLTFGDLSKLADRSWLDISAGWGDRLITAAALRMRYRAADPNTLLQPGYQRIIKLYGDPLLQQVEPVGFEDLELGDELFDVVLSSPPYFNLEIYNTGEGTQSISRHPERTDWLVKWMFPVLEKAWKHLRVGGYLILHLGDNKEIPLSEETNLFIETYLEGSSWQGVIGVQNKEVMDITGVAIGGYARPVWVWQKRAPNTPVRHWEPPVADVNQHSGPLSWRQRSLYRCYPVTYMAYLDSLVGQYAPAYAKIKEPLLAQVYGVLSVTGIDRETVSRRLSPLLLWLIIQRTLNDQQIDMTFIVATVKSLLQLPDGEFATAVAQGFPSYAVWKTSLTYLQQKIQAVVTAVNDSTIQAMIPNDLWLTSLLEAQGEANTIKWCAAQIRLNSKDY